MANITGEMTINEVINKHPETMKVFNKRNVDSCCGGAQSLKVVAAVAGVDLDALLAELTAAAGKKS